MPAGEKYMARSRPSTDAFLRARRHLARKDPVLRDVIGRVGPCTLEAAGDRFAALVRAVVAQMISTAAARTIFARLETVVGRLTPEAFLAAGEERLRGAGLSGTKARGLADLAAHVTDGRLPLERLDELADEEVIARLVPVRGIGRWTAEMFLIFSLGRLDVLPVDDFGLRAGVRDEYGLKELPGRAALRELAEGWRPYRSVATWYMWRSRGFVPQSGAEAGPRR
jgi:DNA-3-methyladenine glycosylase II